MTSKVDKAFGASIVLFQRASVAMIVTLAVAMVGVSLSAAFGILPWLELPVKFGETALPYGGMYLQLFFTAFSVMLAFYLPAHMRMMKLENSHRKFHVSMHDVAGAYRAAHEGDRAGLFNTGSEFDAVRERLEHLRSHPDLAMLEPEILELASQMSVESRDLARIYSDTKVERARTFLRQRQQEMDLFEEKLQLAQSTVHEIKNWMTQLDTDERIVADQMAALESDLRAILPYLGYEVEEDGAFSPTIVPMAKMPEDEDRERALHIARNLTQMRGKSNDLFRQSTKAEQSAGPKVKADTSSQHTGRKPI